MIPLLFAGFALISRDELKDAFVSGKCCAKTYPFEFAQLCQVDFAGNKYSRGEALKLYKDSDCCGNDDCEIVIESCDACRYDIYDFAHANTYEVYTTARTSKVTLSMNPDTDTLHFLWDYMFLNIQVWGETDMSSTMHGYDNGDGTATLLWENTAPFQVVDGLPVSNFQRIAHTVPKQCAVGAEVVFDMYAEFDTKEDATTMEELFDDLKSVDGSDTIKRFTQTGSILSCSFTDLRTNTTQVP
jgi:hypothetical protein